MKFAAVASAAAALVAVANAAVCDVMSLKTLLISPDTSTCAKESGYIVTSLASPTRSQLDIMCANAACQSVLAQIKQLAPTECTLGTFSLYADLIDPLSVYCDGGGSSSNSSSGSSVMPAVVPMPSHKNTSSDTTKSKSKPTTSNDDSPEQTTDTNKSKSKPTTSNDDSPEQTKEVLNPPDASPRSSSASIAAVSAGAFVVAVAATFF